MGLFDSIESGLGGLANEGEKLLPGFLQPGGQQSAGGLGMGTLFNALKGTGQAVAGLNPISLGENMLQAVNPASDMDPFQRALSLAPIALPALGMGGYRAAQVAEEAGGWRNWLGDPGGSVVLQPGESDVARAGVGAPVEPGVPDVPGMPRHRQAGLDPRTQQILGAADDDGVLQTVLSRPNARRFVGATGVLSEMRTLGVPAKALAPIDYLVRNSLVAKEGLGGTFDTLYKTFTDDADTLLPEQRQQLAQMIATIHTATKWLDPEMSFAPLLRVDRLVLSDAGAAVTMQYPSNMRPDAIYPKKGETGEASSAERQYRFGRINARSQMDLGIGRIDGLVERGLANTELQLGPRWYPQAHDEIGQMAADLAAEKGPLPNGNTINASTGYAAVAFTSAQEEWRGNAGAAFRALRHVYDERGYNPDGSVNPEGAKVISEELKAGGDKIGADVVTKILRLRNETPDQILKGIGANYQKERNFYLNLNDPTSRDPVTVDRHAYDAFYGLDSGIPKRPIEVASEGVGVVNRRGVEPWNRRLVYNTVADAYREVARRREMSGNAVQAVAWEQWKYEKAQWAKEKYPDTWDFPNDKPMAGRTPWQYHDPFRLDDITLSILEGRNTEGLAGVLNVARDMRPGPGVSDVGARSHVGLQAANGAFGIVARSADAHQTQDTVRLFFPSHAADPAGTALRFGVVRPVNVQDGAGLTRDLFATAVEPSGLLAPASVETHYPALGADSRPMVHPGRVPGDRLMFEAGDSTVRRAAKEVARRFEIPEANVNFMAGASPGGKLDFLDGIGTEEPTLLHRKLGPSDVTMADMQDLDGPLYRNAWVGLSGALSKDDPKTGAPGRRSFLKQHFGIDVENWDDEAKTAELGQRLRAMGYEPFETLGKYGDEEPSWIVHGLKPSDALKLAEEYHQDSVVTNYGFLYGKHSGGFNSDGTTYTNAGNWTSALPDVKYVPEQGRYVHVGGNQPTGARPTASNQVETDQAAPDFYSESQVSNGKVKFALQMSPTWKTQPVDFDVDAHMGDTYRRSVDYGHLELPPNMTTPKFNALLAALDEAGVTRARAYTHHPMGEGWSRLTEHHFTTPAGTQIVHRSAAPADFGASHAVPVWMRDHDAGWYGTTLADVNRVRPQLRDQVPQPQGDGTFLAHNDTIVKFTQAPTDVVVAPTLFNTKIGGRRAQFFSLEAPDGQLPILTLSTTAITDANKVTGQVRKNVLHLSVPNVPGGIDVDALVRTLAVVRRNSVLDKTLEITGASDGKRYTGSGEAA